MARWPQDFTPLRIAVCTFHECIRRPDCHSKFRAAFCIPCHKFFSGACFDLLRLQRTHRA